MGRLAPGANAFGLSPSEVELALAGNCNFSQKTVDISGTGRLRRDCMLRHLAEPIPSKVNALAQAHSFDEAERAQIALRLADMRRVLGDTPFSELLEKMRGSLTELVEASKPFKAETFDQVRASAILLGLTRLEMACRLSSPEASEPADPERARDAARAALDYIDLARRA